MAIPNVDRVTPPQMHQPKLIAAALIVLAVIIVGVLATPFVQVQSGYAGVLSDFGSVQTKPLYPGLHLAIPFYQTINQVSVQPQTVTSNETGATHDLQMVNTSIAVTFHIDPKMAPKFYQDFRNFDILGARIISPAVSNDVKAVTANYDAEELVTKRDIVANKIKSLIVASLAPYNLTVEAVNVSNFSFSKGYTEAIEKKQVAQQQALQAQYTLKQTQISAQQQVVQAKAQADAAVATAQGNAHALMLTSQAQAKANLLIAKSLTSPLLQQKALNKWNGTLPAYLSPGTPMPFIGDAAIANKGK